MASACVIGDPIAHSLSPKLHGYWLRQYGIADSYVAERVTKEHLPEFMKNFSARYIGCNVTLPHKETIMAYMDDISDTARAIGAINMIIVRKDGSLLGDNTDAFGFMQNIKSTTSLERKQKAVVLGAGGAARAAVKALLDEKIAEIFVINRTQEKAETLARDFGIKTARWEARDRALEGADLLINATSLGLKDSAPLELDLAALPKSAIVNDMVYSPLVTPLLAQAKARGNITVDGLGMLLWQAVPTFEAWFGVRPEVTPALREYVLA